MGKGPFLGKRTGLNSGTTKKAQQSSRNPPPRKRDVMLLFGERGVERDTWGAYPSRTKEERGGGQNNLENSLGGRKNV